MSRSEGGRYDGAVEQTLPRPKADAGGCCALTRSTPISGQNSVLRLRTKQELKVYLAGEVVDEAAWEENQPNVSLTSAATRCTFPDGEVVTVEDVEQPRERTSSNTGLRQQKVHAEAKKVKDSEPAPQDKRVAMEAHLGEKNLVTPTTSGSNSGTGMGHEAVQAQELVLALARGRKETRAWRTRALMAEEKLRRQCEVEQANRDFVVKRLEQANNQLLADQARGYGNVINLGLEQVEKWKRTTWEWKSRAQESDHQLELANAKVDRRDRRLDRANAKAERIDQELEEAYAKADRRDQELEEAYAKAERRDQRATSTPCWAATEQAMENAVKWGKGEEPINHALAVELVFNSFNQDQHIQASSGTDIHAVETDIGRPLSWLTRASASIEGLLQVSKLWEDVFYSCREDRRMNGMCGWLCCLTDKQKRELGLDDGGVLEGHAELLSHAEEHQYQRLLDYFHYWNDRGHGEGAVKALAEKVWLPMRKACLTAGRIGGWQLAVYNCRCIRVRALEAGTNGLWDTKLLARYGMLGSVTVESIKKMVKKMINQELKQREATYRR
jgi:hypothetical protein